MTAPRIEIDLAKIRQNTQVLVDRLSTRGITVTGVTKAVCGHPDVALAMLEGGAVDLADARTANIRILRDAGITCSISLIRTPMHGEIERVVLSCDVSYNTEISTILKLADTARRLGVEHGVILMVEMGDMRDGILPEHLMDIAALVVATPGVDLCGIAANFACLGNAAPTPDDMAMLSKLAQDADGACGRCVEVVSGGSSSNLPWALGSGPTGRTNNLRLGEAILLGVEPVTGQSIEGLHLDAFMLFAEVIETKVKPCATGKQPMGATPVRPSLLKSSDRAERSILAVGKQDTDAATLGYPPGMTYLGATSDHTVISSSKSSISVGSEVECGLSYAALMRAMSAHDVAIILRPDDAFNGPGGHQEPGPRLKLV